MVRLAPENEEILRKNLLLQKIADTKKFFQFKIFGWSSWKYSSIREECMLKSYSVVNLYMAKFVEMDEKVTLKDQMQENETRSVILINKFNVVPEQIEQFLKAWTEDATNFKEQPGFISTQLHKGVGKSTVFINYAVWESMKHYKNAVNKVIGPDLQSILSKYPDSLIVSPHLFKKVAISGICID